METVDTLYCKIRVASCAARPPAVMCCKGVSPFRHAVILFLAWSTVLASAACGPVEESVDEAVYIDRGLRIIVVSSNYWASAGVRAELERLADNWRRTARNTVVEIVSDVPPSARSASSVTQQTLDVANRLSEVRREVVVEFGRLRYDGVLVVGDIPAALFKATERTERAGFFHSDVIYSHPLVNWKPPTATGYIDGFRWYEGHRLASVAFGRVTLYGEDGTADYIGTHRYLQRLNSFYESTLSNAAPPGTEFTLAQFIDGGLRGEAATLGFGAGVLDHATILLVEDTECGINDSTAEALQYLANDNGPIEIFSAYAHGDAQRFSLAEEGSYVNVDNCYPTDTSYFQYIDFVEDGFSPRFALFASCHASAWGRYICEPGGLPEQCVNSGRSPSFVGNSQSLCPLTLQRGQSLACVGSTIASLGIDESALVEAMAGGTGIGEALRATQAANPAPNWFHDRPDDQRFLPIDLEFKLRFSQHVTGDPFVRSAARNAYFGNMTGYYRPNTGTELDETVSLLYGLALPTDDQAAGVVVVWDRDVDVLDSAIVAYDVTLAMLLDGQPTTNLRYTIPVAQLGRSEGRWATHLPTDRDFDFWVVSTVPVFQDGHTGLKRTVNCYMPRQSEFYSCND